MPQDHHHGGTVDPGEALFHAHRGAFGWDTSTIDPGAAELQAGATVNPGDDALDLPLTLRLGAGPRTEFHIELSAWQLETVPGEPDAGGFGDMILGVRHRLVDQNGWPSAAVLLQTKLPTGNEDDGLSSGEVDAQLAAILTKDFDGVAATLYHELGIIGAPEGGTDLEHATALVTEVIAGRRWGLFGQLVALQAPAEDVTPLFAGAGVSFNLADNLAWDIGANLGLNDDAPEIEIFAGFTWGVVSAKPHRGH